MELVQELKKQSSVQKVNLWRRIADELEKPTRHRRIVNISKIEKIAKDGETIIVPGKVLGTGSLNKKMNVAAYNFSKQAVDKILGAKGNAISIPDLMKSNPKGNKVRIIG